MKLHTADTAAKWVRMLRRFVIRAWIDYECSTSIAKFTTVTTIFFCWIRYVMEEVRRNLSWKRQPYLSWFGLIHAKRKQTMGVLKMPSFCRVRLLTGDEHAHSFCRCVHTATIPLTNATFDPSTVHRPVAAKPLIRTNTSTNVNRCCFPAFQFLSREL